MRLKYEKVIHHAIVNNLFRWQYTKKSCNAQGSSKYYLFVTAPSKGHGIETMLNYYGLDVDDSYCFGDGANDLEMFKTVGHPIAMKNAIPMIYHHASIICEDVLHDGVAKELKRLF